jgi:hypothetical protein
MRFVAGLFALATFLLTARDAAAYRPFDGTDAEVAPVGGFELELGPVHYYAEGQRHYLLAPATVLNFGFASGLELVVDFHQQIGLERVPEQAQVRVLGTDVLLKWVVRRGTLQDETGPSIAIEAGPLVPEIRGDKRFGAQGDFIFSHRWKAATLHLNEQVALTRREDVELFSSVILEGPHDLAVRPVAEVFVAHDFGEGSTYSGLVGAIWTVREELSLDVGARVASAQDQRVAELRLGFTWGIAVLRREAK